MHSDVHALYSDHHGWRVNWLRRGLRNTDNAADMAQDTFLHVLGKPEQVAHLREPRAWLSSIAQGFEAQISGEIMSGWQLLAGYTYAQPRDKEGIRISSNHPELLFKLATSYQLNGDLKDLTPGGTVSWQGSTGIELDSSIKADAKKGSFAVAGLMARYDIYPVLQPISIACSIANTSAVTVGIAPVIRVIRTT